MKFKEIILLLKCFTIMVLIFELMNWSYNGFYNEYRLAAYLYIILSTYMIFFIHIENNKMEKIKNG